MKLTPVTNIDAPQIQIYRSLRDNKTTKDNSFIADSPKVVNALLQSNIRVRSILATDAYYEKYQELLEGLDAVFYIASKELMQRIVGHKVHHNVMMHGIRPKQVALESLGDRIVMLDELSKTENIGSIVRSAVALGVDSMVAPSYPHPYGRRALRVSMGHINRLNIHTYDDIAITIQNLKDMGYYIYAAEVTSDATPLYKVQPPKRCVILMGNEHRGISPEVLKLCDETITIEMDTTIKSFNVAIATSIILYQFSQKNYIN